MLGLILFKKYGAFMTTKAYHAFSTKLEYFSDDIDLIDVLKTNVKVGNLNDENNIFKEVKSRHMSLARRQNTSKSRELVINHLKQTVYSAYVKDIYEEVTHYLREILRNAAESGFESGRLIGEHSLKIDAQNILSQGNWESIVELITNSVFQTLENERSTKKLLESMNKKLNLNVDMNIIKKTIPYLEVRHFLVHSDGKIPIDFKTNNPFIQTNRKGYIILDYDFIKTFTLKVKTLIKQFDNNILSTQLLKDKFLTKSSYKN